MHALERATGAQRAKIELMAMKMELDTNTISVMHRRIGISDQWIGRSFSEWLQGLTMSEASRVIERLEKMK